MPAAPPSAAGPGAGFSTGEPWLPVDATAERLNVASELHDQSSMLSLYRDLLALRRSRPSPRAGDQVFLDVPREVLAYLRTEGGERSLVVLNFAATTCSLDIAPLFARDRSSTPLLLASTGDAARTTGSSIVLGPLGGAVLDPGPSSGPRAAE